MGCESLQRGFNLLEIMLALLVVAVVVFTGIRYFSVANQQARIMQAVSQIDTIVRAGYEWVQGKGSFAGISLRDLVAANYLPSLFEQTTNNPWNGHIEINAYSSDVHQLVVTLTNVPHNACISLIEKLQRQVAIKNGTPIVTKCPKDSMTFWGVF